jgi:hypothetical protein
MAKPVTGLPVLAMPSTMSVGPLGLDADDHHGGHVGIGAGADQGAEKQFQVFAELKAAVGVGMALQPLVLKATFSQAELLRSSSGRITTWLRMPTRPFSRR